MARSGIRTFKASMAVYAALRLPPGTRTRSQSMRTTTMSTLLALFLAALANPAMAADKQAPPKSPTASELSIDRGRTAVLIMDYENDILAMLPEKTQITLLDHATTVLQAA